MNQPTSHTAQQQSFLRWVLNLAPLIFVVFVIAAVFWPVRTLVPERQPYAVVSAMVKPGEPILYRVDACKYIDAPALVTRQLVSEKGTVVSMPSVTSNLPKGCQHSIVATTVVPQGTPPGRYHLSLTLTYDVNVLRKATVRVKTAEFDIIKP